MKDDSLSLIAVIDTNVLVDYPDIIPEVSGATRSLKNPAVSLKGAHLVIPSAVVRELSGFKNERTDRGKAARTVLKRLRALTEKTVHSMNAVYYLNAPVVLPDGRLLSVLPVHADFKGSLPFRPSEDDMDGQIILTALAAMYLAESPQSKFDGQINWCDSSTRLDMVSRKVILLTNDNGLAIRARERGIVTKRYSYDLPKPYTGRRDLVVPPEVFKMFYDCGRLERSGWEAAMPRELPLVTNEFVVMQLENPDEYPRDFDPSGQPYFLNIGRYDADEDALVKLRYVADFPVPVKNPGQAIYAESLMSPKISAVICFGPAGSGKTFMATIYGYVACKNGQFIGVTAVPCESQSKIGALPGDLDEKMDPDVQPLKNALRNYLMHNEAKFKKELETLRKFGATDKPKRGEDACEESSGKRASLKTKLADQVDLIWRNWFSSVPIDNARGRDFAYELAIYDEFQDQNISQADTLIKRIGQDGKIVLTGDIHQIHAPYLDEYNNGLTYASQALYDSPMVAQVCFTDEEVVRHPLVKMIAERQAEKLKTKATPPRNS